MATATEVKRPTVPPFVNNNTTTSEADSRAPKRPRNNNNNEDVAMKREETSTVMPVPVAPKTNGEIRTWSFEELPWSQLLTDNDNAFFVKQYNTFKVPLLLPGNQAPKVAIRTKLLLNPTEAYPGSSAKPEVHFSAPPTSAQAKGCVQYNERVPILYRDNYKHWIDKDTKSTVLGDLIQVSIPKPGGPKQKEVKDMASRARATKKEFVPPPGATFYDPKISAKWPWVFNAKTPTIQTDLNKSGCTVVDEHGTVITDIMGFFRNPETGKGQGHGWDVVLVLRPYIWASNTQFKYGGSFVVEFMRVISRTGGGSRSYNFGGIDVPPPVPSSSSSSSSSSAPPPVQALSSDFG